MSDPRVLMVALEDLIQEIARWSAAASQTLASATYFQSQAKEAVDRAYHRAAVIVDEAQKDEERIASIMSQVTEVVGRTEAGTADAHQTLGQAQRDRADSSATLQHWEDQLAQALAWLDRARHRLALAIAERERARRAVEQARYNLSLAESRLRGCQNDKNRSDCFGEARAVDVAEEAVREAGRWLDIAEIEVSAAEEEVEAAEARVRCCSRAVQFANEAVDVADEEFVYAEKAVNAVERSSEFARAAEQNARAAEVQIAEVMELVRQMQVLVGDAVASAENAATHLLEADRLEESAQRFGQAGRRELEYRIGHLREFNKPDLFAAVEGPETVSSGSPSGPAIPPPPSAWNDEGIKFVNVADLPEPEGISGSADFRKVPADEMRAGLAKLAEMRPQIENGTGATIDYWADRDRQLGLDYHGGYQRIYEAFFGADCIKVNQDADRYDVDNGRHRIWLAKRLGVEQLPMRVVRRRVNEQ
jgi:hypothetical protein